MTRLARRAFLGGAAASVVAAASRARANPAATGPYICPPCGCAMDGREFDEPGDCPACGMRLVSKNAAPPPFEPATLATGSGVFLTRGGRSREDKRIAVHYYKPERFAARSPILLVLPGAGRNGDDYRDSWIGVAESANVLVASPSYPEQDYDFAAYQMGGVIENLVISNMPTGPDGEPPSVIYLRDEDISFTLNPRREEWLFHDFDRIFALVAAASGSTRTRYDMFGHSAGAQILHRHVLFHPVSNADRIVAANSGLYTLPDLDQPLLIGLRDTGVSDETLAASLACRLTLLLGELDNSDDAGGIQLHTPMFDRYGVGRLSRGRVFFETGLACAERLGVPCRWRLETVPKVGHDFRRMGEAAAQLFYG